MKQRMAALIILFISLAMILIITILALMLTPVKIVKYEYYTFDGELGISNKCVANDNLKCEVNGKMEEVSQYSDKVIIGSILEKVMNAT